MLDLTKEEVIDLLLFYIDHVADCEGSDYIYGQYIRGVAEPYKSRLLLARAESMAKYG